METKTEMVHAWLLDIQAKGNTARLIFKGEDGTRFERFDDYFPYFYVVCAREPQEIAQMIGNHPKVIDARIENEQLIFAKGGSERVPVINVIVDSICNYEDTIKDMKKVPGIAEFAETRIPHYFRYALDKRINFFNLHEIETDGSRLVSIKNLGERGVPKLVCAAFDGGCLLAENGNPIQLHSMKGLHDLLLSRKIDALFSWDARVPATMMEKLGCLHIALKNDISMDIYVEEESVPHDLRMLLEFGKSRLLRTIELSMMCNVAPAMVSRITPGSLNTYLHMSAAKSKGYLIPDSKKSIERPKSLRLLRLMDNGGLIFYPEPGIYSNVAKCDFASMYPNIIVKYNISPEAMHCSCGNDIEVPESGWRICRAKEGIIPCGIKNVLERRLALKKRMKEEKDPGKRQIYNLRQRALKNILVTCFGYLGFSNFIFSNVECKECVMLYGREILLRTKTIAEECGLEVIYGIVDSVFVKGGTNERYTEFAKRVSDEISITLELDSIFRKIAFPCADDSSGIANKYYGISEEGELECRGIALRHSDAPRFIKEFQENAIRILLSEKDTAGNISRAELLCKEYETRILKRDFSLEEFAITKSVRHPPDDYVVEAAHVTAFRQAPNPEGVSIYVHTVRGPKPTQLASLGSIDCEKYAEMLWRSYDEIIRGLGSGKKDRRLAEFC